MTTKDSPIEKLREQASRIVALVKSGMGPFAKKKGDTNFTIGIVMDDKILRVIFNWDDLQKMSSEALTEMLIKYMQEQKDV